MTDQSAPLELRKDGPASWLATAISLILFSVPATAQPLPGGADPGQIEKRFQAQPQPLSKPRDLRGLEATTPPE